MSSVHSQSSNTQQQMNQEEVQTQVFNGNTPAIKEEEEETEAETVKDTKPAVLKKKHSFHSSPNSTSSSNSNGNSNRSISTITFEKQKVIPHRARTQSAQSVLSNISLRSLLHQNQQHQPQQQQNHQNGEQEAQNNSGFVNFNQQIQSPAMSFIRKRGVATNNGTSNASTTSANTGVMFRRNSSENEIGLQLPFTDDKRLDLESSTSGQNLQRQNSKSSFLKENQNATRKMSEITAEEDEDEDVDSQKRLTTQALRKLSNLKANGRNMSLGDRPKAATYLANRKVEQSNPAETSVMQDSKGDDDSVTANDRDEDELGEGDEGEGDEEDVGDEYTDNDQSLNANNLTNNTGSMTHLRFGNKKVFLDSSSFTSYVHSSTNKNSNISTRPVSTVRKHSLDVIQQPNASAPVTLPQNPANKRIVKQISNPKKPLYMPAVLRDVSETNITIDDVVRPASPQHTLISGTQNLNLRNNHSASSQASVYSNNSSILESCRRHISSFLFQGNDRSSPDPTISPILEAPAPPTRDHWLPDSKRSSCHYCHKIFTFLERKHHCRHCGDIFCQQHLAHWLYLNSTAQFIIGGGGMGTLSKICDGCLEEYENTIKNPNWKSQKAMRQIADGSSSNPNLPLSRTRQSQGGPEAINVESSTSTTANDKDDVIGSVVGSVPADWNWSSF